MCIRDRHNLVILINRLDSNYISCLFCDFITLDALAAAILYRKFTDRRPFAQPVFRHDQQIISLRIELHANDFIIIHKINASDSHGDSSCAAHICFIEPDTLPILGNKNNILGAVGKFHFNQFIVILQSNSSQTGFSDIFIIRNRRFLYKSLFGCHEQIMSLFIPVNRNYSRNFFTRLKLQQIDDCRTAGRPACFRYLIGLKPVNLARIGKEHQIMVGSGHQKFFYIVILYGLHSLDALSSTVLAAEIIYRHPLNISQLRHGNNHIFSWYEIFHGDIKSVKTNRSSSVIAIFF